jgi:hypothetical protein
LNPINEGRLTFGARRRRRAPAWHVQDPFVLDFDSGAGKWDY